MTMRMKLFSALFVWCLLAVPSVWGGEITLKIGGHTIHAEVADTQESRARGLMLRKRLPADHGMLFVFDRAARHGFWMVDTPIPLSIAFIDAHGVIINIAEMAPQSDEIHSAQSDVPYALEMGRGWFTRHGVQPGQVVRGLKQAPQGR